MKKKKANKKRGLDRRYGVIKSLYDDGLIHSLIEIFDYVPRTVVAGDLHTKVARLNALLNDPKGFELEELYKIGELCGLSERQIYILSETYYLYREEEREKKIEAVKDLIQKLDK